METYLDLQHFNPITKRFMVDESGLLSPTSDFKSALFLGLKKITGTKKHIAQVEYAVIRFTKGLDDLAYSFLNISDVKIHHIKNTLEYLKLPDNYYNKFRSYIMGIFKELIQYGCINHNLQYRGLPLKKYPYTIFYKIDEDNKLILVNAVFQANQDTNKRP